MEKIISEYKILRDMRNALKTNDTNLHLWEMHRDDNKVNNQ